MFASLAPARRRLALGGLSVLLVAVLVAALLGVLNRGGGLRSKPVAQDVAGPVLLVPGYGGSTTGLNTLADRLRARGKDVTVLSLPDSAQGDLAEQAKVVDQVARAALGRTGAPSVDLVGYSAGGVVARIWLKQDGGATIARRVITLGSPQHGTELAALGSLLASICPLACQQLVPGSPVLRALNAAPEVPAGPELVSFWTSKDQVVLPPDSAELAGATNIEIQSVCANSDVGHGDLPTDPLVAAMVADELSGSGPVHLTAADCARLSA